MNIKEIADYFQLKSTSVTSNFEKNVHKPFNKYLKDYPDAKNHTIQVFFEDEYKSYITYLQESQLSPNTIRNYICYIFESLSHEIIKSNVKEATINSAKSYMQPIVSSVTKKANEYQKMMDIQVKDKSDIDINEIVPEQIYSEHDTTASINEITHLLAINNRLQNEVDWLRNLVIHLSSCMSRS